MAKAVVRVVVTPAGQEFDLQEGEHVIGVSDNSNAGGVIVYLSREVNDA